METSETLKSGYLGTSTTGITINNSGGNEARPRNIAVIFGIKT
jgi:hypothetical protein